MNDLVRVYENQIDKSSELGIPNHALHILETVMCLLNLVQSDSYNWQDISLKLEHEGRRAAKAGFKQHLANIMEHISHLKKAGSVALSKINGNIHFSEDKVNKTMNWAERVSPKIGDHLEEHYLRMVMKGSVDPKIQLNAFRDQPLKKISTSEAAVERVFSRHKLVHSPLRSCL